MIVLVLGGARSGKSAVAEQLAAALAGDGPATVLATAVVAEGDADMAARVAAHRDRRPASWPTVETGPELVGALGSVTGTVVVDSVGTWVASQPELAADAAGLCAALGARSADTVVVSEEVGLGVHPTSAAGRRFRDVLGQVNQAVASVADHVLVVVAGRAVRLSPAEDVVGAVLGEAGG